MGKWATFVLGMLLVPASWGAWWVFAHVQAPSLAWFGAGALSVLLLRAAVGVAYELRLALGETSDEAFRPWFRPFWRLMRRAGLTAREEVHVPKSTIAPPPNMPEDAFADHAAIESILAKLREKQAAAPDNDWDPEKTAVAQPKR